MVDKHLVVCGYPRSGTSLFYNILSGTLVGYAFYRNEVKYAQALLREGNWATKRPLDILDLDNLRNYNVHGKEVKVVVTIRDIRDIITSYHENLPHDYFIGYRNCYTIDSDLKGHLIGPGIRDIFAAYQKLSENRSLTFVRYEDLISNPTLIQRRLRMWGLKFNVPFTAFHLRDKRIAFKTPTKVVNRQAVLYNQKMQQDRVGRWMKHRDRIYRQFTSHPELFDILEYHKYERDRSWFAEFAQSG